MAYSLNFNKQALKQLEKIDEPHYSKIKEAISGLTENPRPQGYKKLKGGKWLPNTGGRLLNHL